MNLENMQPNDSLPSSASFAACLADLDDAAFEAMKSAMNRRAYHKGEIVCFEGEPCPGLILVEAGWIKGVKTTPLGREQEVRLAGPGEMINEISVMVGADNLLMLKSLEESVLWVIERQDLLDLLAKHPRLSQAFTQNLAKQGEHLLNLIADLALRPVDSRLARLLLSRAKENEILRENWYTEAEMAARVGTTSEIISRVLNEMEDEGILHVERHKITILDRKLLEEMAFQKYKK